MRKIVFSIILVLVALSAVAQEKEYQVEFKTNVGSFTVKLYNETPLHRDNFLALVREGAFNNLLFHRVIKNFMVQAGGATKGNKQWALERLQSKYSEMIPAEFHYPKLFHKRGALAAARQGDEENPEKKSDPIQFYIVIGQYFLENELAAYETEERGKMPDNVKQSYMTEGGTPHLDTQYTVFGELLDGMKTIEKIENQETDTDDRPIKDIYIISAKIIQK
ncbi:MAG: peptidylprolyl isomerase [Bacteroidales bacterium]|uniref:peptidylprolyl isomerase n=1 Tax=Porphyromonas sp. TaxID=1924944 RepID=UPI002973F1C5|nr:peptidylprolyl isomerase [Porphyromonas sp.]MDD7438361.1 peptidylprolyl isomerase [Bacteroidales bacterium]MDY3067797.1 peptidylprolyl isomerase [Porphyromonas sp.]